MSEQVRQLTPRPWTVATFEVLAVGIGILEVIASGLFLPLFLLAAFYLWLTLTITRKRSLGATGIFTALTVLNIAAILLTIGAAMFTVTSLQMAVRSFDWLSFAAIPLNMFQLWLLWNPLTKEWLVTDR
jgi:hypothetical protein